MVQHLVPQAVIIAEGHRLRLGGPEPWRVTALYAVKGGPILVVQSADSNGRAERHLTYASVVPR
jgi:hypothetical protein